MKSQYIKTSGLYLIRVNCTWLSYKLDFSTTIWPTGYGPRKKKQSCIKQYNCGSYCNVYYSSPPVEMGYQFIYLHSALLAIHLLLSFTSHANCRSRRMMFSLKNVWLISCIISLLERFHLQRYQMKIVNHILSMTRIAIVKSPERHYLYMCKSLEQYMCVWQLYVVWYAINVAAVNTLHQSQ